MQGKTKAHFMKINDKGDEIFDPIYQVTKVSAFAKNLTQGQIVKFHKNKPVYWSF